MTLTKLRERLEDETPVRPIRDEMMKDLEQLEVEFIHTQDSERGSREE